MRRTSGRVAALLVAGVLALSGCTGGSGGDPTAGEAAADAGPAEPVEATGSARTVTGSMAETTADVPGDSGETGTLTLVLRAVEVSEQTMTVRWAMRWDSEESEPDAALSYYDMGLGTAVSVIDTTNLKAYRPFCTDGTWKGEAVEAVRCKASMLASARDEVGSKFPNHGTVEGWASLPAPEGRPATVDVIPVEGLPGFTQAEVTYLDGGS
jgi:hypothetical protein